ncbi:hypothetical protein AB835_07805 [Candidatus Endobugula sertula]|uniref:Uncharacterized protein n=1 Tax=Candidatus Endobugula sertula TaxID=62101 RepID=A0A1D2QPW4_9GAMM|nr:hypothetical protein AB835_07805 [Candidatus Endobugula sertula]
MNTIEPQKWKWWALPDLNWGPTDSGIPKLSFWPGLYHHPQDAINRLIGGVLDANGVLRNKFVLLHLVSEPSSDTSEAWLLIGMLLPYKDKSLAFQQFIQFFHATLLLQVTIYIMSRVL